MNKLWAAWDCRHDSADIICEPLEPTNVFTRFTLLLLTSNDLCMHLASGAALKEERITAN